MTTHDTAAAPSRDAVAAGSVPSRRRPFLTPSRRMALTGLALIGPIMLYWLIFTAAPLVAVIVLSFYRWNGYASHPAWVGGENYRTLWRLPLYLQTLWHTIIIAALVLVAGILVAFAVALLLNTKVKARGVYRTVWYLPTIVSFAIIAQLWNSFIDPTNGLFDNILKTLGLHPIIWSLSTFWMIIQVILLTTWKGVGATMIIFLAGLQGIDPSLYEAAHMDGAGALQRFRHVTIPSLRPILIFVAITGGLGAMRIFEPIYLLTKGGPYNSTTVIIYRIYEDAFQDNTYGTASALAVVFMFICLGFTFFQLRFFSKQID